MADNDLPLSDDELRKRTHALLLANTVQGRSSFLKSEYCYVMPSAKKYPFQWFWDSCFHVFMLCALHEGERAKRNLSSLMAMQDNDGFVGHMIFWQRRWPILRADFLQARPSLRLPSPHMSSLIQPSFVAQALLRIQQETGDREYLADMLPRVKKYLRWLGDNRDFDGDGLLSIINPLESGMDFKPSFDQVLGHKRTEPHWSLLLRILRVDLNNFVRRYRLKSIAAANIFRVKDTMVNTAYVLDLQAAAELCDITGDKADAEEFRRRAARTTASMLELMYDAETLAFYDLHGPENKKLKVLTPTILFPFLLPGIPKELAAPAIRCHLDNPSEFATPYPVPSVAVSEPSYSPTESWFLWRGPSWMMYNWFLCRLLFREQRMDRAQELALGVRRAIGKSGFREYYHPFTGEGYGEYNFTWSGLIVDMLDSPKP